MSITRTVEIEDTLQDHVDTAIEEVKESMELWAKGDLIMGPPAPGFPCLHNDLDYNGSIHEIIDGCVPIYHSEIRDIFYLHGEMIEDAFDSAGIGNKTDSDWPCGWKPAAIYCYIEQQVGEWYQSEGEDYYNSLKPEEATA